ncbi:probable methyltransferase PMT13 [Cynara cardunculus var. scolymus]|uniref:probable methyltransferase PMT13 n=1 Tax=Cynara cardunculus var. scolymus TaxID=59895 RepID=UPI000D628354|nr:probable methyltransferase PMT13 [Cynara cardunculus var. scolymus]
MRHLDLISSKHNTRQWRFLDFVSLIFFAAIFLFFVLVLTPLGDSIAASGSQALITSTTGAKQRHHLIALIEAGRNLTIQSCPSDTVDYMPCEDPNRNRLLSREMNYYRERHCPPAEERPLCLIPPPEGYNIPIQWPTSLYKIWHENMPYNKLAERKGHQGWMKKEGPHFIFPGGGTMFPDGAVHYIEQLEHYIPISGGVLRTVLDMGCGVASFGGYLLAEDLLTLSFAPRDSHKSQIQFALERGIPAFVLMLGTRRLPFPAFSFDLIHCSRCLIPFTAHNATYFMEVDRLLRPGGYLVISGPPVQWHGYEKEWEDLQTVAKALCYDSVVVDGNTAIWKKPTDISCLKSQKLGIKLCDESDDPSSAWYYGLKQCVSLPSSVNGKLAVGAIPKWPQRLTKTPSRATVIRNGNEEFELDTRLWQRRISFYKESLNLKLGTQAVRNVMDMNAFFGGFAASLISDPLWVMNIVPHNKPSTLGAIFDRGLIGVYHDWCEPFSSYPRTYDFIHVASFESLIKDPTTGKKRCNIVDVMVEIDRLLRPEGTFVVRDSPETIKKLDSVARSVRWESTIHDTEPESHMNERILVATKPLWTLTSSQ